MLLHGLQDLMGRGGCCARFHLCLINTLDEVAKISMSGLDWLVVPGIGSRNSHTPPSMSELVAQELASEMI